MSQTIIHSELAREARPFLGALDPELSALRRFSPRRNLWPKLAELDGRVAELDQRAASVGAQLQQVREELRAAPTRDAEAHAAWIGEGERGKPPAASAPRLEERVADLERQHQALVKAAEAVVEEKVKYVERHRKRLIKEANKRVTELRMQYEKAIDQTSQAREALAETRQATLWAMVYPDRSAGATLPAALCGGRREPLQKAGVRESIVPVRLWALLRDDSEWLAAAITREQLEAQGVEPPSKAYWDAEEGYERAEEARLQALERFRREWSHDPGRR
jgi:hypothetical protein